MALSADDISALQTSARALSSTRDHRGAIRAWRTLCAADTVFWGDLLGLIDDLRRVGLHTEADQLHRRAILLFPQEFWLLFHWVLSAKLRRDFAAAEQRMNPLRAWLEQATAEQKTRTAWRVNSLLGELAMQRFAFADAAYYFQHAVDLIDEPAAGQSHLLQRALHLERTARSFGALPALDGELKQCADYRVFVINLEQDRDRLASLLASFQDAPFDIIRVPGIAGSHLPKIAVQGLRRSDNISGLGALGCLLGHLKAWETMLQTDSPVALILEDDVAPNLNFPGKFAALNIPETFDLCFVNDRMEPQLNADALRDLAACQVFDPVEAFLTRPPTHSAPGADGYFISRKGAEKLLHLFERDGFSGEADWRMLGYCMTPQAYSRLHENSIAYKVFPLLPRSGADSLTAYALVPSLVSCVPFASTIAMENEK